MAKRRRNFKKDRIKTKGYVWLVWSADDDKDYRNLLVYAVCDDPDIADMYRYDLEMEDLSKGGNQAWGVMKYQLVTGYDPYEE